ncbi:coil containing protein [Vibrio phage 1.254.O._10N.286.45.C8]|nr:coil containing protein [Vibrio phage 1.254.O._10N.286.45.C8]
MLQIAISKLEQHNKFTIVFIGGKNDGEQRIVNRIPPTVNIPEQYKRIDLALDRSPHRSNTVAAMYAHHALTDAEVLNIILTRYVQGLESKKD